MELVWHVGSSAEGTGNKGSIVTQRSLVMTTVNTYCKLLSNYSFRGVITWLSEHLFFWDTSGNDSLPLVHANLCLYFQMDKIHLYNVKG